MCSVFDDFEDTKSVLNTLKLARAIPEINVCNKCKTEPPCIVLRAKDRYCKSCFLQATDHKFKALLGKHKVLTKNERVLVLHKGGHSSTALLYFIRSGLDLKAHKQLRFRPVVLFIDDQLHLTKEERLNIMYNVKYECEKFGFEPFFSSIVKIIKLKVKLVTEPESLKIKNGDYEKLKTFLQQQNNATNKKEFLAIYTRNLLVEIAKQQKCNAIFTPELSLDIAAQLLTDITVGRGVEVAGTAGFCDKRQNINILKPLRCFDIKELVFYNYYNNLEPVVWERLPEEQYGSIQSLIKKFVGDLQINYPATVTTILRTGDKLAVEEGDGDCCEKCGAPTTKKSAELNAEEATKFSDWLSKQHLEMDELFQTRYEQLMSTMNMNLAILDRNCYACSNLKFDNNNDNDDSEDE